MVLGTVAARVCKVQLGWCVDLSDLNRSELVRGCSSERSYLMVLHCQLVGTALLHAGFAIAVVMRRFVPKS